MAYKLQPDESVRDGLRRCAREQLDRAIEELTTRVHDDPVDAVHEARKSLKKARSLLRLGRGAIDPDERRRENAALRRAGRALSSARDAEVMIDALDDLADRFAGRVPRTNFDAIRRHLEAERDPARRRVLESGLTDQVADELKAVRNRVDDWSLHRGGWDALEPGLRRSYARGRDAFELVRRRPTVENLHDWRKRSKDLWYQLRLLEPLAPGMIDGQAKDAHRLADVLGDLHDLAVLEAALPRLSDGVVADTDALIALVRHRREQLATEALSIGERVYAESTKRFVRRLRSYWRAWRAEARAAAKSRPAELAEMTRHPTAA
jgi:CHAD domain-containing protein